MNTKTMPELIFTSDGFRTILNVPWECPGCLTMHYFFINTVDGHRCVGCAMQMKFVTHPLPKNVEFHQNPAVSKEIVN